MKTILQVSDLHKTYGGSQGVATTHALKHLNLSVQAGEFISVMGPSGSGKTTLLNLLAGLDTPTGGAINIDGRSYLELRGEELAAFRRQHLGFVFQDFNLLDTLTLAENVSLPLLLGQHELGQRVQQTLALLGIAALADRFPYQVSGGQQQRAAVARAIVHQPSIVLADEPTGNLDSASSRILLEQFVALNQVHQVTILLVTHDPFAASHAQRVVFIKDGMVAAEITRGVQPSQSFRTEIHHMLSQLEGGIGDV